MDELINLSEEELKITLEKLNYEELEAITEMLAAKMLEVNNGDENEK